MSPGGLLRGLTVGLFCSRPNDKHKEGIKWIEVASMNEPCLNCAETFLLQLILQSPSSKG